MTPETSPRTPGLSSAVAAELAARITADERTIAIARTGRGAGDRREAWARSQEGFARFDIAVCLLLQGDAAAARAAFDAAAEAMFDSLAHPATTPLPTWGAALESALLAGNRSRAEHIASSPPASGDQPGLVHDRLAWANALPALVLGDDEQALVHAQAAAAVPDGKAWYPGLGDAAAGLVQRDDAQLADGLRRVLAKHVRYARGTKSWCYNSGPCLLCVPAVVVAVEARRRGVAVPGSVHEAATVPFALLHSVEAQPAPRLDLDVAFVPRALVDAG